MAVQLVLDIPQHVGVLQHNLLLMVQYHTTENLVRITQDHGKAWEPVHPQQGVGQ
jgi:hypothetical protein